MRMLSVGTDLQAGFSLLELIVVLVLGGMLVALLPPRLNALMESVSYQKSVQDSVRALERARMQAVIQGTRVYISVDAEAGALSTNDVVVAKLPESLGMDVSGVVEVGRVMPSFFFDPDGSASGGRLVVRGKGRQSHIELDWLTGQISLMSVNK